MSEVRKAWPAIRSILPEYFTFTNIKNIVAAAGLDIQKLAHLQQRAGSSVSKGNLIDGIEKILFELEGEKQSRIITYCISEMIQSNSRCQERLEELLYRFGWGILDGEPYPIELQVNIETEVVPEPIQKGLAKALKRYRDGDMSGCVTTVCGLLDTITEQIYDENNLGNHKDHSYHERISKAYNTLEEKFKDIFRDNNFEDSEIIQVWQNQRKAVSQSAHVLGSYRRNISDVHGDKDVDPKIVQLVLDNAIFVIRAFC